MPAPRSASLPAQVAPEHASSARFTLGAFAIILDDQHRVLLCHRPDYDVWNLPGGGVEPGEAPWQAVVREVAEEVGLQVAVQRLIGIYNKPEQAEVVFSFLCSITGGTLTRTDEADDVAYFAIDEIPGSTLPKHVERIHDALRFNAEVMFKTQLGRSSVALQREARQ